MKIYEVIENNLYHFMAPKKAIKVFSSDIMEGQWIHNIPGVGDIKGINKAIKKIEIMKHPATRFSNSIYANESVKLAKEYAKKYGIKFVDNRPRRVNAK